MKFHDRDRRGGMRLVTDAAEAQDVLAEAVAELRELPYWKLRRRVKMTWTWADPIPAPPPGRTAVYMDMGSPTVRLRRGPSGTVYRVLTLVCWANSEKDL